MERQDGYKIYVEFEDGLRGVIDFEKKFTNDHRDIMRELIDMEKFNTVKIERGTLCWDNEVDFCPDCLHELVNAGITEFPIDSREIDALFAYG